MASPEWIALWSRPDDGTSPLVVLLHGQRGSERDLAPLFPLLPSGVVAVSLRAPHAEGDGWSWFVTPDDVREAGAEHVAPAADALVGWIAERSGTRVHREGDATGDRAPRRPVAVVGYSQGGTVAIHLLRRAPLAVDTAAIIAGFLGVGDEPGDDDLLDVRPPVFWIRGLRDESIGLMDVQRVAYFLPPHSRLTTAEHPLLGHDLSDIFLAATARYPRGLGATPLTPRLRPAAATRLGRADTTPVRRRRARSPALRRAAPTGASCAGSSAQRTSTRW